MRLSVIISKEREFFVVLAADVDIASQDYSVEEALTNLKEALELYFEDEEFN